MCAVQTMFEEAKMCSVYACAWTCVKAIVQTIEYRHENITENVCVLSTQEVFERCCQKQVGHVLDGFNACIFAYGQTGSGKTYTIFGEEVSTTDTAFAD